MDAYGDAPARRSAPIARTGWTPLAAPQVRDSSPRRSAAERAAGPAHEGPRDRRGRVHRPLGRRRAARARPHGPPDRQPRRGRRGQPRGVRRAARAPAVRGRRRPRRGRLPALDGRVDAVAHLAASISVQDSIDDPATTFENDVVGTFNLLEGARAAGARFLFMSTCMVYDRARRPRASPRPTRPTGIAVRRVQALRRGADAVVPPRLRHADDGRPAVQHVRPVPALGRGGRRRRDLHPPLAPGRGAADLRRRDPDARPALRRGLRPVRVDALLSDAAIGPAAQCRDRARTSRSTSWRR